MNVFKRAWLYVTRKKKKSLILLLVLFSIATLTLSTVAMNKAAHITRRSVQREINHSFEVSSFYGDIPAKALETISKVDGIVNMNRVMLSGGVTDGFRLITSTSAQFQEFDKGYEDFMNLEGNDDTRLNKKFIMNSFQLVEGRHITKADKGKVLMHKELAQFNNLTIGDNITIKGTEKNLYSLKKDGSVTLEIVGLFESVDNQKDKSMMDMPQNHLISDNTSIMELDGMTDQTLAFVRADFFVKDSNLLDKVIADVKKLPLDLDNCNILGSNEVFTTMTRSLDILDTIINRIFIGVIVFGIAMVSFLLTCWIRGRIHETGILLSIGTSKIKIMLQYVIEISIIAVVAFTMACFSGQVIAQSMGNTFVAQASDRSKQEFYDEISGMGSWGADADSQLEMKTVDAIDVKITPYEVFYMYWIGAMIVVVSVSIASLSIVRLQPKEILSRNE